MRSHLVDEGKRACEILELVISGQVMVVHHLPVLVQLRTQLHNLLRGQCGNASTAGHTRLLKMADEHAGEQILQVNTRNRNEGKRRIVRVESKDTFPEPPLLK